jgi:hypothetical protein
MHYVHTVKCLRPVNHKGYVFSHSVGAVFLGFNVCFLLQAGYGYVPWHLGSLTKQPSVTQGGMRGVCVDLATGERLWFRRWVLMIAVL